MAPVTFPPHIPHSSHPVLASEAQSLISQYLALSETTPHLHPDALLSTAGVQFSTTGGAAGGLVLHNLRRVEAGLRGEHLAPEPEADVAGDDVVLDGLIAETEDKMHKEGGEGWQDPEEFQREQGEEEDVGELGDRSNVVEDGGEVPEVREDDGAKVDKEARKKAKKEKRKAEQRAKEQAKKKEA